ncbi:NAD(P)-binding protein [Imleria badia]|jgi:nucleoside-diphosphate-sugar epimerase|nr:NAD(P)-binding protein [Imleria badia]
MSTKTQVFFTGATGYVGGSVMDRLLRHPTFATSEITALVRKADKAAVLESLGIKTVLGSYDDHAVLEKQASLSDIIFSIADSDNADANNAILRGLKKRYEETGKAPILIHTTGSAIVMDDPKGAYGTEEVWDDTDLAKLDTIADTQIHRNVDAPILAADKEGYLKAYLVCPSTIFGLPSGKLLDLGVQNTRSIQIPMAIACSIGRKRAGFVGKGLNVWPAVHVEDTTDVYTILYDAILAGKAGHGREGLYFVENGHYVFKDVSAKIGEALLELGVSETAEPNAFVEEDFKKFPWLGLLGTNCRCRATRIRALGWEPKYPIEGLLKSVRRDVEAELKATPSA